MSTLPHDVHVFGVVGSPRKKGNTSDLVESVLKGARSVGAQTHKLYIKDLKINPCHACDYCRTQGKCFHVDDMAKVFEYMIKSKVWVIGTPVYWWGPTAQVKAMIDRWYGCVDALKALGERKVILAIPFADEFENTAEHTVGMLKESLDFLGKEISDIILAPGVDKPGELRKNQELLQKAFEAGKRAAAG